MFYIYHHLGLGDHLMCNSIVRIYAAQHKELTLFCKQHNVPSVSFMYKDLPNINISIGDDDHAIKHLLTVPNEDKLIIGFSHPGCMGPSGGSVDDMFYSHANISLEKRWTNFNVKRNLKTEIELFNRLGLKEQHYIFVHDDSGRGASINLDLIKSPLPIIIPKKSTTDNIFDYCHIIEHAKQIHCIDSSFKILVEHLNTTRNLFFHTYPKLKINSLSKGWGIPTSKKEWINV
jgi:hypothetical protein